MLTDQGHRFRIVIIPGQHHLQRTTKSPLCPLNMDTLLDQNQLAAIAENQNSGGSSTVTAIFGKAGIGAGK